VGRTVLGEYALPDATLHVVVNHEVPCSSVTQEEEEEDSRISFLRSMSRHRSAYGTADGAIVPLVGALAR
jgi:hypothetical protein